jgi:pheromone a factor receptor
MALALTEILIVLPLNLISLIGNLSNGPLLPWNSWSDVHYNFARIAYVPKFLIKNNKKFFIQFTLGRWAIPCSGLLFFVFFGMSREARKDYDRALWFLLGLFGMKKPDARPLLTGSGSRSRSRPRRKMQVLFIL